MAFLLGKDRESVEKILNDLPNKVKLIYFTQDLECQYCRETHMLVDELAEISDNLTTEVYNFQINTDMVEKYAVDKIPALAIVDEDGRDYGIRYYGIPVGYEFTSLLEGIKMVGKGESGLSDDLKTNLKQITTPVHLQVFVTPTCPHCPGAVINAHKFAYENDNIRADMVEVTEFPQIAVKYNVKGVPRSVVDEESFVEGSVPEGVLLDKIIEAQKQAQN